MAFGNTIKWQGVIPALITPMQEDGKLDVEALQAFYSWQDEQSFDALVVAGSTGEGTLLTLAERSEVWRNAVEVCERTDVIAGVSAASTKDALMAVNAAEKAGCHGLLLSMPYYIRPCEKAMQDYLDTVLMETSLPVVLYDIPQRAAVSMSLDFILRNSQNPKIVGIKDASGSLAHLHSIILQKREGFSYYMGDDAYAQIAVLSGGDGVISVVANAIPKEFKQVVLHAARGERVESKELLLRLEPYFKALQMAGNPSAIKMLTHVMHQTPPYCRAPLQTLTESQKIQMKTYLAEITDK